MQTNDTMAIISTDELKKYIGEPGVQIIDVRPVEAYNGWKLKDEPRGGHIKGAWKNCRALG